MKKSEFDKLQERYNNERRRLEGISRGDLVWDAVSRGGWDLDYHPAVVESVNVDEDFIRVVDVSRGNRVREMELFLTESELLTQHSTDITGEDIRREYEKYKNVIDAVKEGNYVCPQGSF
ncbi:MAG: hypothetical protein M1165_01615 [Candidatus Pacearchaeota archaeon]|nr:hypothetical protein [Candidatus Pacearchaeota archaeon]